MTGTATDKEEISDWVQLWEIATLPDNVPIVLLILVIPFYAWYGLRQAVANDRLIDKLATDPEMAKTHHRKTQPWKPGWDREVQVWPYLLRMEFLVTIIVTFILMCGRLPWTLLWRNRPIPP